MKPHKAAGPDGIPGSVWKRLPTLHNDLRDKVIGRILGEKRYRLLV
eukprot:gene24239-29082_t